MYIANQLCSDAASYVNRNRPLSVPYQDQSDRKILLAASPRRRRWAAMARHVMVVVRLRVGCSSEARVCVQMRVAPQEWVCHVRRNRRNVEPAGPSLSCVAASSTGSHADHDDEPGAVAGHLAVGPSLLPVLRSSQCGSGRRTVVPLRRAVTAQGGALRGTDGAAVGVRYGVLGKQLLQHGHIPRLGGRHECRQEPLVVFGSHAGSFRCG